jgi:hypothetical protein
MRPLRQKNFWGNLAGALVMLLSGMALPGAWAQPRAPLTIVPVERPQPVEFSASLVETSALIRATQARTAFNVDGSGLMAAVLDTGARVTHQDFAGKTILQRNYTTDNGGDINDASDGNGHGSNCAGIVLAHGVDTGIAPGANLGVFKVLDNTGSGSFDATDSALDWIIANHAAYNITVVSMSLGALTDDTDDTIYGNDSTRSRIQQLRSLRIPVVIAAGNAFYVFSSQQGMAYPAIFRESVSVGAVYDANIGGVLYEDGAAAYTTAADRITPFSQRLHESVNSATRTDIFAPGAALTSTGIDSDTAQSTLHGTSQATPVIAGVILLMQQLYQRNTGELPTVDQLEGWLRAGAVTVNDGDDENDNVANTGLNFLRVDVMNSLSLVAGISINDVTVTEGNSGSRNAVFTVTLSPAADSPVTVQYSTADGTATAGSDYVAKNGTLTFAHGETSKTISVPVNSDTTLEGDETFTVKLSNATGAPITRDVGTGTILNDDVEAPSLVVTTTEDVVFNTDNETSLREAIYYANRKSGADTITFKSGLSGTITLNSAELPVITDSVTIAGPGAGVLVVSGNSRSRIFEIGSGVSANVSGLTIKNGSAINSEGGAILNHGTLTLSNCTLNSNNADWSGGAISNAGTLTLQSCTLSGSYSDVSGGGIYSYGTALTLRDSKVSDNRADDGGGIYNYSGTLTLKGCTLSGNRADYSGGGVYNSSAGTLTLENCSLSGNTAGTGGGIDNAGTLTLESCTLSGNRADSKGGGIGNYDSGTHTGVHNSIIAGNSGGDVDYVSGSSNSFVSQGHNLIGSGNAIGVFNQAGDLVKVSDPKLGTLADNGGPTPTMALLAGSPALNAGDTTLVTDQRGLSRPQGAADDIGAYELAAADTTAPVSVTIEAPANGAAISTLSSINGTASDNEGGSGIKGVTVVLHRIVAGATQYWDGDSWTTAPTSLYPTILAPGAVNVSWSLPTDELPSGSNLPVGTYYLRAWAYDQGNRSVYSGQQNFNIVVNDTTAPVSVNITTPANGSSVGVLSSIAGNANDNTGGSGIKSVSVVLHRIVSGSVQYWSGSSWTTTPPYLYPMLSSPGAVNTNWSLASSKLPSGANLPVGTYYLRAWAYDQGSRSVFSGQQSFNVVDMFVPVSVTITTPANGVTISTLSGIGGSAKDNDGGSGIKSVSVVLHRIVSGSAQYWNGSTWVTTASYLYPTLSNPGAVSTNWSLASNKLPSGGNLSVGTYYLRAWAYDQGNRSVYSGQQSFEVIDTFAPVSVTITTPANGSSVSVLSSIAGSASDNDGGSGIKSVSVVLHRIVDGSTQYWNGSVWSTTASYLYPTLSSPGAVTTNWSLASNKLPSGANLPAGTYYLRAWAYDQGNRSVFSGQQSFKVGASGLSATPSSVKLQDVLGIVSSSRIVLTFGSGLQSDEASDASHYAVTVGGARVSILSASYASSTHRVTLQLSDGALRGGEVVVGYRDLRDAQGNLLEQAAYTVDAE